MIYTIQVMDEEVCSALEAAEEARALLPALLSAFDNHQVVWVAIRIMSLLYRMKVMTIVSPDELLQRATGLDHKQPGGRHCGAQTVAWWSAGVGQGADQHAEKGFVRVGQVLPVLPFQVREGLVVKKEELTRISGPIFERVDRAYRRLEEVHGRQGGGVCV